MSLRFLAPVMLAAVVAAADSIPYGSTGRSARVDWQGVLLPEPSPTGEEETDRRPIQTAVDMYALTPTYSTADVSLPMEGGELNLEFRRRCTTSTWNLRSAAAGAPLPQSPVETILGYGWSTNLAARLLVSWDAKKGGGYWPVIHVFDEDGSELQYFAATGGTTQCIPLVLNSFSNAALSAKLFPSDTSGVPQRYTLVKPHGLRLEFEKIPDIGPQPGVIVPGGLYPSAQYYRINTITDRNGNQIKYVYGITRSDTASNVTVTGHSAGASGPLGDTLPTRIYDVARPGRYLDFSYGYSVGWDQYAGYIQWQRADLTNQLQSLSYPWKEGWRLRKVTGAGTGYAWDYSYTAPAAGAITFQTITSMSAATGFIRGLLTKVESPSVPIDTGGATANQRPAVQFAYDLQAANDRPKYYNSATNSIGTVIFTGEDGIATPNGIVPWSNQEGINVFVTLKTVTDPRGKVTTLNHALAFRPVSTIPQASWQTTMVLPSIAWLQNRPIVTSIATPFTDAGGVDAMATATFTPGGWSNTASSNSVRDVRGNTTSFAFTYQYDGFTNNGAGAFCAQSLVRTQGGKSVTFGFSGTINNNLTSVTDMSGVVTTYTYSSEMGDEFNYRVNPQLNHNPFSNPLLYELYNKPASRTVAGSQTTQYRYTTVNGANLLKRKTDPSGLVTDYGFDAKGNRVTETIGGTVTTAYVYDPANGEVTKITDPDLRVTNIARTYATVNGQVQVTVATTRSGKQGETFDAFTTSEVRNGYGHVLSRTSPTSAITTWTYDALGRQQTETLPAPASTAYRYYDAAGNLTRELDHGGNCTLTVYDARGNPRTVRRRMNSPTADDAADLVTSKVWDAAGLLLSETDALGRVTQYAYDALLRPISKTLPPVVLVVPGGSAQTFTETYAYGANAGAGTWTIRSGWNPTRVIGADGVVTDSAFDSFYRRTQQVQRVGVAPADHAAAPRAGEPATVTTYNQANQPTSVTQYAEVWNGTGLTADTRVTYIYYDALQRKTLEVLVMEGGSAPFNIAHIVADGTTLAQMNNVRATGYAYDSSGNVIRTKDAVGAITQTTYDGAGRPLTVVQPSVNLFLTRTTGTATTVTTGSPTTRNTYDKHLLRRVEDPHGTVTQFTYDARDRRTTTVVDLDGNGVFSTAYNGPDRVEVTDYDAMGNVIRTTDSRGNATDIAYDRAYRKVSVQQPSVTNAEPVPAVAARPLTATAYDKAGNVTLVTDARGVQTQTTYDAWNRAITVKQALGTTVEVTTETRYDARGNVLSLTLTNGAVSGGNQTTTYEYDELHRKTKEILPTVDASVRQTTWAYTRNGEAYQQTDPKGQVVRTAFSRAGQPLTVTFLAAAGGAVTETRTFTYDLAGRPVNVVDGAGTTAYTYDLLGRQLTESRTNTGESTPTTVTARYDAVGNRTWVDYPGAPVPYTLFTIYDRANRATKVVEMAGATTKGTTDYTYDANGNRLSQSNANGTVTTWSYDALNRNLLSETKNGGTVLVSTLFSYDLVGNRLRMVERTPLLPDRTVAYTYDAQYRLIGESWQ